MSEFKNQGPWFRQYHKEYPKWSDLYNERYGGKHKLYKFETEELAELLRISFPLYHNCAIAQTPIKAGKLLSFITESFENEIGELQLKEVKNIIKSNYKKNDVIDVEQSFNIFKLLLQKHFDLDPNQSDICTRQILAVFGNKVGYTFESLSKPGIQIADEYISDSSYDSDEYSSSDYSGSDRSSVYSDESECSCRSSECCSVCESVSEDGSYDSEDISEGSEDESDSENDSGSEYDD